jgi:hypothetical protein
MGSLWESDWKSECGMRNAEYLDFGLWIAEKPRYGLRIESILD